MAVNLQQENVKLNNKLIQEQKSHDAEIQRIGTALGIRKDISGLTIEHIISEIKKLQKETAVDEPFHGSVTCDGPS